MPLTVFEKKVIIMWKEEIRKQRPNEQQLRMDILTWAGKTMSGIEMDLRNLLDDDTIRASDFLDFRQKLRELALDLAGLEKK